MLLCVRCGVPPNSSSHCRAAWGRSRAEGLIEEKALQHRRCSDVVGFERVYAGKTVEELTGEAATHNGGGERGGGGNTDAAGRKQCMHRWRSLVRTPMARRAAMHCAIALAPTLTATSSGWGGGETSPRCR